MKKIRLLIRILMIAALLVGCGDIATPDELLVQPAISLEKKAIKDAIESFLPDNCGLITLTKDDKIAIRDSFSKVDIDADGSLELIFFCKDKKTKAINGMVLRETDGKWSKLQDLSLDASDILRYQILDLDADGNQEIIIGFFSNDIMQNHRNLKIFRWNEGKMEEVLRTPYDVMDIGDLDGDQLQEIALVIPKNENFSSEIRLMHLHGTAIDILDNQVFSEFQQPFLVRIGKLDEKNQVIFVDSYAEEYTGVTDIFWMQDRKLKKFQDLYPIKLNVKAFPVDSEDIDKDGVIEVAQTVPLPSNREEEIREEERYAVNYFKLKLNGATEFVKQVYFSESLGLAFDVPIDFVNYYDMTVSENSTRIECSYYTSEHKKYPLFEIRLIHRTEWPDKKEMYQFIDERGEQVLAGRLYDRSEELEPNDRERYQRMRAQMLHLPSYIRPLE